jgi:molybdate transport system permease protein
MDVLGEPSTLAALRLSLLVSSAATAAAFVFGFPLGWWLARGGDRAMAVVRPVVLLPLVLPPVVGGVGLLAALGRRGIVGAPLAQLGVQLPFTTAGAVVAATFVSLPLVALAVEGGFRALDPRLDDAAAVMGSSRAYTLRRVTLPLLGAQVAAGVALGWARALGEFGATITFAGNLQGRTQTLPLAVYELLQTDPDAAIVVSLLLVAVAATVLIALHRRLFGAA